MSSTIVIPLSPLPDPLEIFERLSHLPSPILLESASDHHDLGRYSFASADPVAMAVGSAEEWPRLRTALRRPIDSTQVADPDLPPFQGGWAGWFSYELGAAFDRMPRAARDDLDIPDLALGLYDWVVAWDHQTARAWLISSGVDATGVCDEARARVRSAQALELIQSRSSSPTAACAPFQATMHGAVPITAFPSAPSGLTGDFTPTKYQQAVARVIEYILDGDIFQANLTQRFVAPFTGSPVSLYRKLRQRTHAPMAALLRHDNMWIASASPERFLRYDSSSRAVETRPIKGTHSRGGAEDAEEIAALLASEKDRAENVMIVDLLRNDLSRVCVPGSVAVPSLCAVESHPTVHHLVSTVTGTLAPGKDALDLLAAAFPGGSITGAPKLRAMAIISELEPVTRGVYCGAIGWIGLDGAMDTSIVIRTIICSDGVAVMNAGGGITAQSDPAAEYQETIDKAVALVAAVAEAG